MNTPVSEAAARVIGRVESVRASEIKVLLETEAPQATAFGPSIQRFPRINGYVVIPIGSGLLVATVTAIWMDPATVPVRRNPDQSIIDLPFPVRRLTASPIGTLQFVDGGNSLRLSRGVSTFPPVGCEVALPTSAELRAVVGTSGHGRVHIGTAPLADSTKVSVDPDRLFGRHLAVLGNTGSGKSCSVAGLIRWSHEAARSAMKGEPPNTHFVVLDPNGEYATAFRDKDHVRLFQVSPESAATDHEEGGPARATTGHFDLPSWMWNSKEWATFTGAASATQRPALHQVLRHLRSGVATVDSANRSLFTKLRAYRQLLWTMVENGPALIADFPGKQNCGQLLKALAEDLQPHQPQDERIFPIVHAATTLYQSHESVSKGATYYAAFSVDSLTKFLPRIDAIIADLESDPVQYDINIDSPVPFRLEDMPGQLNALLTTTDMADNAKYMSGLTLRINEIVGDRRLKPIIDHENDRDLAKWLEDHLGIVNSPKGQITIIDLSLVPSDVLTLSIAAFARLTFEALQRLRRLDQETLPVAMVLEEAHNFIRKPSSEDSGELSAATLCRETFEKIAREGRKFGLGLVVSSQRPSELSATVLAQCNTFLLHRLVNDRDQDLVQRMVPDSLGGIFQELPSLPSRQAILLGWATELPVLVEMRELAEDHRPRSSDPEFWNSWIRQTVPNATWQQVADDWQKP
ncbi:ATP-binding protein [Arthrobacter phoenicis]|uniref:ATP-binding protein n=2 Tax=Arthrobacter TaxID=1663 RepID=UPI00399F206E